MSDGTHESDAANPREMIANLAGRAEVLRTPCGDGDLVWHCWGEGTPVVFAHGGSGSWTHWIKTIPFLSRTHRVCAVDLPGLGASTMPNEPYTAEHCGQVLATGVREIFGPDQRPHFVAFSFGAHVSSFALVELGDKARQFVIVGCAALGLPYHGLKFLKREEGMSADEVSSVYRTNLERLMFADPSNVDDLAVHIQTENVANARFRSRRFASTAELRDNLPKIRAPLAAIWGRRDATALPSPEERIAVLRQVQPDLPFALIDDAGHWVMYEAADQFNETLFAMLQAEA